MRAVAASTLGLERLVALWNAAYAGYFVPMSWDVARLRRHVDGGSIDLDRSLVWMVGCDPVALSLLGVREPGFWTERAHSTGRGADPSRSSAPDPPLGSAGVRAESAHSTGRGADPSRSSAPDPPLESAGVRAESAHSTGRGADPSRSSAQDPPLESGERGWIGGFGIASSHRGRGLAANLMREQLDVALDSGVRHVQLEVLTENWAARSYERAGFVTTRRLLVLRGTFDRSLSRAVAEASHGLWLDAMDVPDLAGQLSRLHRAHPAAWTREVQSVLTDTDGRRCVAVGPLDALAGALILTENEGVLQVADAAALDAAAAERLVSAIVSEYPGGELRVVNEPEDSPLADAFAAAGLVEVLAQYEMHWYA